MSHRGSDGTGLCYADSYALGHVRLAIFDTSDAGLQPMESPDGDAVVVLNGEILNHAELRVELAALGWTFASASDAEVLSAAYRQWGLACLDRLHGMFAFAIREKATGSLLLVRDRFGIKPLYYYVGPDGLFAFGSEPKSLIPLVDGGVSADLYGVSAYLTLRHVPAPRTLFRELSQIPPGEWLRWEDGRVSAGTWWRLADQHSVIPGWCRGRRLRFEIDRAVELWSRADTPIASLLSGGLDSAALAAALSALGCDPALYTGEYDHDGYSEFAEASQTAASLGQTVRLVRARAAVDATRLAELIRFRDHPLGMHNEIALVELARAVAADGAKVMLCGEGADELFSGYGRMARLPFEHFKSLGRRGQDRSGWRRHVRGAALARLLEDYPYLPLDVKLRMLRPEAAAVLDDDADLVRGLQEIWDRPRRVRLHRRLTHFLVGVHLPGLLAVLDGDAMASGIEARVPFLDHRLVIRAYRLPQRAKLRWRGLIPALRALRETPAEYSERRDTTKWLLRRAYSDVLPAEVLTRPKRPFPAPLDEWFASAESIQASRLVLDDGARVHELFQPDELRRWWAAGSEGRAGFGRQAWILLNLEVWLRLYFPPGVGMLGPDVRDRAHGRERKEDGGLPRYGRSLSGTR